MQNAKTTTALVTTAAAGAAMAAPHQVIDQSDLLSMIGTIDKNDLIVTIKHARKSELTGKINIAVGQLAELEGSVTALQQQFNEIGPDMVDGIDITAEQKAAEALNAAGFGKLKAYAKFESRDDKARRYDFEVFICEKGDEDNRSYSYNHKHSKYVHKPFTAEAKTLIRKIAAAKVQVQKKQAELMAYKSEMARMDDLGEAAHAELVQMVADKMKGGRQVLNRLLGVRAAEAVAG